MAVLNFIQAPKFVLSGSGTSIGDTTIILQSMVGIDLANIVTADLGTKAYGTLEPGNGAQEEAISFTGVTQNANGTATLTGVKTCLFKSPYTETSGLAKTHAGASTFILSNDAGFYNNIMTYVNTSLSSGAVPATTSVNGIVQMSVAPVAAPTPIAVGDNDPRLVAATMAATVGAILFPVGAIYTTVVSTNPNTLLGFGTWTAWGTGRVPVGIDTGQTEFNTVEKTGGEKTHVLTEAELAAHTHTVPAPVGSYATTGSGLQFVSGTTNSGSAGSNTAHNNLQPYITCYMWKRTA